MIPAFRLPIPIIALSAAPRNDHHTEHTLLKLLLRGEKMKLWKGKAPIPILILVCALSATLM
jgi:hypothetical protein